MPELPEVETTLRGISNGILHKKIKSFDCRDRSLRWPIPKDMSSFLKNENFESAYRRGKYIILNLANKINRKLYKIKITLTLLSK